MSTLSPAELRYAIKGALARTPGMTRPQLACEIKAHWAQIRAACAELVEHGEVRTEDVGIDSKHYLVEQEVKADA